ncbi:MAG: glutathione S-transferase [Thiotrichales bacterium]|nr:glutathione S-transferase [Thiotrichales bacterium]
MLEVWGRRISGNVIPVMWTVAELGLEYTRYNVGGGFSRLDTEEYSALNPNHKIPTIRDHGRVLWESNAIIRYLSRQYGVGSLWPTDDTELALADQWMEWTKTTVLPHLAAVYLGIVRTEPVQRKPEAIAAGAKGFADALEIADRQLSSSLFMVGDQLTMGDITLGAYVYRYFNLDIERPSLPNVEVWYRRLCDRETYQKHVMVPFGSSPAEFNALEQAVADDP